MATNIERAPDVDRAAIEQLVKSEPDWLGDLRRAAFTRYEELPQPDATTPGWRRLSLEGIDLRAPRPAPTVFTTQVSAADRERGLVVCSLADAARSHEGDVRQALSIEHKGKSVGRYAAIAEAAWQDGVFVYAPAHFVAQEPVRIELSSGTYPRVMVLAGEGAQLTVAETHREQDPVSAGVVDLLCGGGAVVRYLHVQDCARTAAAFSHQRAMLERDARLITLNFGIGGRFARTDVEVELRGPGAESDMLGLVFAEDRQQFDYRTLQGHRSPNTRSDLLFKAALDDQSHASYTGVIVIDRGAQRSDAYQANRNLLLKEGARADTEPMLEIEADDVRCTHGATVGPVDEEQLFYARSRGLEADAAARLIVEGFFAEVFEKFGNPAVTDSLRSAVAPHLGRVGAV
ncbi:MAG: Fe-S cluster assembly protein SufD [Candidatus Eremiobacteraeota bacterium]|nr:Fe-S cluster assembly protein SufD [Candidatus Eremiobacteraeota bacterium]MBV8669040.1 Fe-S cluster assembly protein SufD [Candidatus Eremiobacteraeota bacterium]